MTAPASTVRLFYAFELSDDTRAAAAEAQNALRNRQPIDGPKDWIPASRWTLPGDLHITALFLGDQPSERLIDCVTTGKNASRDAQPFDLSIGGLGRFPASGPPRILWMGVCEPDSKPASALVDKLRTLLPDIEVNHRTYRPHITLAYLRPANNAGAIDAAIANVKPVPPFSLVVDRFVLMQTIPDDRRRKTGAARYNIVQAFPFET